MFGYMFGQVGRGPSRHATRLLGRSSGASGDGVQYYGPPKWWTRVGGVKCTRRLLAVE